MSATPETNAYTILGPRGERLYPSHTQNPGKYRSLGTLPRDPRRAVKPQDWNEIVTVAAKLVASDPGLMGVIRQRAEWAFAGDSWQPIYYGAHERWGALATDWLAQVVFPNALRCNPRKDLIKAMQVSAGTGWTVHGGDLALFSLGAGNLPQVTIIPGTRIGNGEADWYASTLTGGGYAINGYQLDGMALLESGRYAGYRIYNGFIFDDADEVVAVRVLGKKRVGNLWEDSYADFALGFEHGAHFASEYDWHGLGRPLPKFAASLLRLQQQGMIDENLMLGINNASRQTVTHKLGKGADATSRGNVLTPVTISAENSASGLEEVLFVEYSRAGDTKYIGADEELQFLNYQNPHPNVEDFVRRMRSECLLDLGWPFELTDLSSTGRAPTRLSCELANNSLWQTQCTGETRLLWFVKFGIAQGIKHHHLPSPPAGALDEPYKWTFGYPKEMSVDAGNDVTASLNRLRYGLTSQRIESAKWGYVLQRVRQDRLRENVQLITDADALVKFAESKGRMLPFIKAMELLYQPSVNAASIPAETAQANSTADPAQDATKPPAKPDAP